MKDVVVSIDEIMSICDGFGIEKRLLNYPGVVLPETGNRFTYQHG